MSPTRPIDPDPELIIRGAKRRWPNATPEQLAEYTLLFVLIYRRPELRAALDCGPEILDVTDDECSAELVN